MQQRFINHSEIQCYIETTTSLSKEELFINVQKSDDFPIILAIQEDEEDRAEFLLTKESAQKIFDWLKSKGLVQ